MKHGESELEVEARLEAANYWGDVLLSSQYYDVVGRRRWQEGEYRLAFAVLADAVASYYKYRNAKGRKSRMLFEEVRFWMKSRSRDGIFAYQNLCEALGIDPSALSRALEGLRDPSEPALREIRVWRGKPERGLSSPGANSWHRRSRARALVFIRYG